MAVTAAQTLQLARGNSISPNALSSTAAGRAYLANVYKSANQGGNITGWNTLPVAGLYKPSATPKPASTPSASASTYDPNAAAAAAQAAANAKQIAAYNQAISNQNAAYNRQGTVWDAGISNAQTAYNQAINNLNQQKALDQQTYNTNQNQTKQDYVGAKNTIGANAGTSLNSLLRLLGAKGAGGSSAYLYSAPQAVARQATLQRTGASDTYGKNIQSLDTNWGNYINAYKQNQDALGIQKQNDINKAESTVRQSQASILQELASLFGKRASIGGGNAQSAAQPYLNKANSYLDEAASLGKLVSVPKVAPAVYTAPSLSDYTVNPNATPTVQGQASPNDYVSPYLAALLGRKQNPALGA